jgi:hypothetical protein
MNSKFFNKQFYEDSDLRHAIADYSSLSKISIFEEEAGWRCEFENCRYDLEITMGEFCNYLISLMNSRARI